MLAAGMAGLWWGERGRRLAAERREIYGVPLSGGARRIDAPPDAEERAGNASVIEFGEETVERGAKELQAAAKREGRSLGKREAMDMARQMLHEAAAFAPEDGVSL